MGADPEDRRINAGDRRTSSRQIADPLPAMVVGASVTERRVIGDMKQGLTSGRPKLSIVPGPGKLYGCRGLEYGENKYARGNYYGPPPATTTPVHRFLGYLDATHRHLDAVSDALNRALGTGGDITAACRLIDSVSSGGFPASGLPHVAHAMASLLLLITVGVEDGLLVEDPGQPWKAALAAAKDGNLADLPQKDDPAAERARVAALAAQAAEDRR